MQNPEIQLEASFASFIDTAQPAATFARSASEITDTMQEFGVDTIQWMPTRTRAGYELLFGVVGDNVKTAISSVLQSPRSEKSILESFKHPSPVVAAGAYVLFPHRIDSLKDIDQIQSVVGRSLPVVLYPAYEGEPSLTTHPFKEKLFQPTPELMNRWKLKTPDELIAHAKNLGYTGFALDLFHIRRGPELMPWQKTIPELLAFATEVDISLGRSDIPQTTIDTQAELKDFLKNADNSMLATMLREVRANDWRGRVVMKIPPRDLYNAMRDLLGASPSKTTFIEGHKRIVGNIQQIFS
jgi:hypothetical protein